MSLGAWQYRDLVVGMSTKPWEREARMRSYWLREMSLPSFPDGPEGLVWSLNREMGGDNFIHVTEVQVADISQPGVLRKGATRIP